MLVFLEVNFLFISNVYSTSKIYSLYSCEETSVVTISEDSKISLAEQIQQITISEDSKISLTE